MSLGSPALASAPGCGRRRQLIPLERVGPVGLDRVDVTDDPAVVALGRVLARPALGLEVGLLLPAADPLIDELVDRDLRDVATAEHEVQEAKQARAAQPAAYRG